MYITLYYYFKLNFIFIKQCIILKKNLMFGFIYDIASNQWVG